MPRGWEATTLGDVADVVGGGTPRSTVKAYFDGDVPWLTPDDLSGWTGRWIERGARNLSKEGLKSSSAKLLPRGAVLFSSRAPIGYVALAANPISTNQGFKSLVLKEGYDPLFFYYLMSTLKPAMEAVAFGATFKEISASSTKELKVNVPPLPEQLRIADLMGAVDEQLAAYEAQIQTNRRRRSALLQELLNQDGGWEETTLGEVADTKSGSTPKAGADEYWKNGTIPFLKIGDLTDGPVVEAHDYVTDKAVKDYRLKTYEPDTLLLAMYGSVGKLGLLKFPATANQAILAITPKSDGLDMGFLFNVLLADRSRLSRASFGGVQKNLSAAFMKDWEIPCPPLPEQLRIADLMSAVDDELDALRDAREHTKTLRTALLQDLLSGAHRIPESYDRLLKEQAAPSGAGAEQGQESNQAAAEGAAGSKFT